jgi:DNA-directed RNA polymerase specialized sigma24 family protein
LFCDRRRCLNPVPRAWKAACRLHAWRRKQRDWSLHQIAEALGGSEGAGSQWMARARQGDMQRCGIAPPPVFLFD